MNKLNDIWDSEQFGAPTLNEKREMLEIERFKLQQLCEIASRKNYQGSLCNSDRYAIAETEHRINLMVANLQEAQ